MTDQVFGLMVNAAAEGPREVQNRPAQWPYLGHDSRQCDSELALLAKRESAAQFLNCRDTSPPHKNGGLRMTAGASPPLGLSTHLHVSSPQFPVSVFCCRLPTAYCLPSFPSPQPPAPSMQPLEAHPESPPGNCALRFPAGRTAELKSSNKV